MIYGKGVLFCFVYSLIIIKFYTNITEELEIRYHIGNDYILINVAGSLVLSPKIHINSYKPPYL